MKKKSINNHFYKGQFSVVYLIFLNFHWKPLIILLFREKTIKKIKSGFVITKFIMQLNFEDIFDF
jgi:hypothetical protein